MHTYNTFETAIYNLYWRPVHEHPVSRPKPQRVIGKRRRYNNSTVPPLDFRSYPDALFD